jgi:hypothetical protein
MQGKEHLHGSHLPDEGGVFGLGAGGRERQPSRGGARDGLLSYPGRPALLNKYQFRRVTANYECTRCYRRERHLQTIKT